MRVNITVKTDDATTLTELDGSPDEVLAVMGELGMLVPIESQDVEFQTTTH